MPSLMLFSAGSNARGQLGTGIDDDAHSFTPCIFADALPGQLPSHIVSVENVSCGANHTLALLRRHDGTNELWGCGDGNRNQLGPFYASQVAADGEDEPYGATAIFRLLDLGLNALRLAEGDSLEGYSVRMAAAGWETSYVVLSCSGQDDVLLSMGADDFGNLGVGSERSRRPQVDARRSPHMVPLRAALPGNSQSTLSVLALCAGPHHTVAHVRLCPTEGPSEEYVVGWGASRHGQLGAILNTAGKPLPFTSSPHLVPISELNKVTGIALGNQHTVALLSSGRLISFGSNRKAQISGLETLKGVELVGCTWNGTYAVLRPGSVVATGSNTHCQLGRGTSGHEPQGSLKPVSFPFAPRPGQVVKMVCGSEHVLCLVERRDDGETMREVWGWGWNEHGNLGLGTLDDVDVPVKIWPRREVDRGRVVDIWAGCGTSWIFVER
ncbi:RCC1/BLIP-II [Trametes polyzona]|nr:RCC1/BLIP-II [Trametes polyzona]